MMLFSFFVGFSARLIITDRISEANLLFCVPILLHQFFLYAGNNYSISWVLPGLCLMMLFQKYFQLKKDLNQCLRHRSTYNPTKPILLEFSDSGKGADEELCGHT